MHRVELKVDSSAESSRDTPVPNAPCGVESFFSYFFLYLFSQVPNAPCGVESRVKFNKQGSYFLFLMHRVELKDHFLHKFFLLHKEFLMHRVELKELSQVN